MHPTLSLRKKNDEQRRNMLDLAIRYALFGALIPQSLQSGVV